MCNGNDPVRNIKMICRKQKLLSDEQIGINIDGQGRRVFLGKIIDDLQFWLVIMIFWFESLNRCNSSTL